MNVPTIGPSVDMLAGRVEEFADNRGATSTAAAREFEAVFTSLLLKQMRQSLSGESLIPSDNGDVVGGMFDLYLGQHISAAGGLGLTEMLQRSMEL